KIIILLMDSDDACNEAIRHALDNPTIAELCTPAVFELSTAGKEVGATDGTVLVGANATAVLPDSAIEIIVTETTRFMPLAVEPTAEDIIKFRDILERDFDLRSPRIAIVQETEMKNPDLTSQVTTEQGINTYGPYSVAQILAEERVCHFDGIVTTGKNLMERILKELPKRATASFLAGMQAVVTAVRLPLNLDGEEEGLADISGLTLPIYTAIDVLHNRATFDEARKNPLPKLYRDKREDRRREEEAARNTEEAKP
ncbi:MAG: hypothetical protein J5733_10785, partial [Bacteroidaceae bacterium]|nr:hypothetical protein [Bacteroidaceae bacterium]